MIVLLLGAELTQPPQAARPPSMDFIVCPGDPRCNRAPPANVQPPPVAVSVACPDGSVVPEGQQCPIMTLPPAAVYFAYDSASLSAEARATLDQIVEVYRQAGASQISLAGHTDRSGSASYNMGLSERYAEAVRDYLVALGIPTSAIAIQSFGETRPQVETPDGVREPQNRRVEITLGGW